MMEATGEMMMTTRRKLLRSPLRQQAVQIILALSRRVRFDLEIVLSHEID